MTPAATDALRLIRFTADGLVEDGHDREAIRLRLAARTLEAELNASFRENTTVYTTDPDADGADSLKP